MAYVIGLMSGTSVDGIDAALLNISGKETDLSVQLIHALTISYPPELRQQILEVCAGAALSMADLAALDDAIATQFAQAAQTLKQQLSSSWSVDLIGSHGQTVFHCPPATTAVPTQTKATPIGYSLQLGRGEAIAALTGIPTVSNFRAADIALGGQGAPLVSKIDACLLSDPNYSRCIQNIGGIGNTTYLPPNNSPDWLSQVRGWDTGPGNVLIDLAVQHFSQGQQRFDRDGEWAASGNICHPLLNQWLQHPFFSQPPPKSTGRELFGVSFVNQCIYQAQEYHLTPADILATFTELTAVSIAHSYEHFLPQWPNEILVCGGGSRNSYLVRRLQSLLPQSTVKITSDFGQDADFKEASAFAILAYWRQQGIPGNLPQVTGASCSVLLGELHPAPPPRLE